MREKNIEGITKKIKPRVFAIMTIIIILIILLGILLLKQNKLLEKVLTDEKEDILAQQDIIEVKEDPIEKYGVFGEYYEKAKQKIKTLTSEEKIAQLFIIGNSSNTNYEELEKYQFGGYLFFEEFFKTKTEEQVKSEIEGFQDNAKIPLLIAVDEEGGKVVRVSSNKNLYDDKFRSPSEIYTKGGFDAIAQDTIYKSNMLKNLGINLNFAPVVDIANNPTDYMYSRALQQDKEKTSIYAKTVINASKGLGVSYTLKHFPGYGNNADTHIGSSTDLRTYEDIYNNDLEPFRAGIEAGAECVMISHNVVTSIDDKNQASISPKVHEILRKEFNFKGIIITDDINMGAIRDENNIEDSIIKAITSGNDMIIFSMDKNTTDKSGGKVTYSRVINAVNSAIADGRIKHEIIDEAVTRILAWKYYKKLLD